MTPSTHNRKIKRKKVLLSLYAPEAGKVTVAGDFNQWKKDKDELKKDPKGNWEKTFFLPPGEYEYKFIVDDCWHETNGRGLIQANPFGTFNRLLMVNE